MDPTTHKELLRPNATCEGALQRLITVKSDLGITKKEEKILKTARQYRCQNLTFQRLKELTEMTKSGTFAPLHILSAVRENLPELYKLACKKRLKARPVQLIGEISGEKRKLQIEKDLKVPERQFQSALHYLYLMKRSVFLTSRQRKILHAAIKNRDKGTFLRLKSLTQLDKTGNYSPLAIKKALRVHRDELELVAKGIRIDPKRSSSSSSSEKRKKLPLDTNYKYPTKTSVSIWTVRKK